MMVSTSSVGAERVVSADCLVHRLGALPLVSAAVQQALVGYERTKNCSGLLNATLSAVEQGIGIAADKADPVYKKLEHPCE